MTRAEQAALKVFPDNMCTLKEVKYFLRTGFIKGYKQAEKDTIAIIESRLSEILGDAQPNPILRMELQGIIDKIKNYI